MMRDYDRWPTLAPNRETSDLSTFLGGSGSMMSMVESVGRQDVKVFGRVLVVEDAPILSAETTALLSTQGWNTSALTIPSMTNDALHCEDASIVVVSDRVFTSSSGLIAAARNAGSAILVVVDEAGDPLQLANRLLEADDWISREAPAWELPARIARLLNRKAASEPSKELMTETSAKPSSGLQVDSQFFALVVHDLRTPLNVIGLSLRMLSQSLPKGDPDVDLDLRFIDENFKQIDRMLAQLGDFYRLFENESQRNNTPFSTRRLVDELLESRTTRPSGKVSSIEVEIMPNCPSEVDLDPVRARMAIQYVLANANASSNGDPIRLIMDGSAARWVISVAIDKPAPPSVKSVTLSPLEFERLCGFAAERRGMDLSIAAKVSELFGGTARLDVMADQGSRVVLDWPVRLTSVA